MEFWEFVELLVIFYNLSSIERVFRDRILKFERKTLMDETDGKTIFKDLHVCDGLNSIIVMISPVIEL